MPLEVLVKTVLSRFSRSDLIFNTTEPVASRLATEAGFGGGALAGGTGEVAVELLEIYGSAPCRDLFSSWRPALLQAGRIFVGFRILDLVHSVFL